MTLLASLPGTQAHVVLEALAYLVGGRVYWRAAARGPRPAGADGWLILGAAVFGAFAGSKLLHVAEHLPTLLARHDSALWLSGKSVLGGFLGGTLAVEIAKRAVGWRRPTGDAWVPALAVGLAIGRAGCQLSGPWDLTFGTPTSLPWAWDYGDHVGRHPTSLYEIAGVVACAALALRPALRHRPGAPFALFLLGYCVVRFGLEFLKPPFGETIAGSLPVATYAGWTAIQWSALAGTFAYAFLLRVRLRAPGPH